MCDGGLSAKGASGQARFAYEASVVFDAQKGTKTNIMCSACNLVCHPEREVRAKRLMLWRQGGVVVQHEDGRIEAMPAEDAREFLEAMPAERRALYEKIDD